MRVSCVRSPPRLLTWDRATNPLDRACGGGARPIITPGTEPAGCPRPAGEPHGTVATSSVLHGWLRRNAVSRHGVRLSGAPGAPLWIGCSSANRALAGKLLWDGIVAVPEVFGAGCLALSPVRRVRAARPSGRFPTHPPGLRTRGNLAAAKATCINCGPEGLLYRVDGPSGFTQAAENHGRTISERHIRNPQRRADRA